VKFRPLVSGAGAGERKTRRPPGFSQPIGIDRGIEVFAALSTGERIDPVNAGKSAWDKRAKLQPRVARKQKHSNNWNKLKGRIARLDHRAANVRRDFAHKVSTDLAKRHGRHKRHGRSKMEDLRIANMSATAQGTMESPGKNIAQKSGLNRSTAGLIGPRLHRRAVPPSPLLRGRTARRRSVPFHRKGSRSAGAI
jgi:putative transposase